MKIWRKMEAPLHSFYLQISANCCINTHTHSERIDWIPLKSSEFANHTCIQLLSIALKSLTNFFRFLEFEICCNDVLRRALHYCRCKSSWLAVRQRKVLVLVSQDFFGSASQALMPSSFHLYGILFKIHIRKQALGSWAKIVCQLTE